MSQQTGTEASNGHPASADSPARTTTYAWVLTLQAPVRNGLTNQTSYGTCPVPEGTSRLEVYTKIVQTCQERAGIDGANVLFFSLEPDRLA